MVVTREDESPLVSPSLEFDEGKFLRYLVELRILLEGL